MDLNDWVNWPVTVALNNLAGSQIIAWNVRRQLEIGGYHSEPDPRSQPWGHEDSHASDLSQASIARLTSRPQ